MKAINRRSLMEFAQELAVADTFFSRMKGLLGKSGLSDGEGLLIRPCKGVSTFGMKFPIDVIFLDRHNRVIATRGEMPPNRLSRLHLRATAVIELPPRTIETASIRIGDQVEIVA